MSEASSYYSSGHFCDLDNCALRTSLKLGTFGQRFYTCHYWSPGDARACKFFKWVDTSICCTRGAATATKAVAKFNQLENMVNNANEALNRAHAACDAALAREEVAKRKAERTKAARIISEKKVEKYRIALVVLCVALILLLLLCTSRFGEVRISQRCLL